MKEKRVLAMYDVRGKQEYIYRSRRIQEIVGASCVIRDVFSDYLYPAVKKVRNQTTLPEQGVEPVLRNGRALKKVMNFRGIDENVPIKYPYVCDEHGNDLSETGRNEDARHVWYQKNREAERDQKDATELLPNILAKNQALHPYQKMMETIIRIIMEIREQRKGDSE